MSLYNNSSNLLEEIYLRRDGLNKSERKVADIIIKDPDAATRYSIAALAQAAEVSEPTVNRFCRTFYTKGYPDFKLQLAQSLASGTPYVSCSVEQNDSVETYTDKIFSSAIAQLDAARQSIKSESINQVVDYLIQAKQVAFFGLGASGPVAMDAQHKFFRFNIPVMAYDDVLMMRMVAASSRIGDVIVMISYTGRTREIVDVANLARKAGAVVIGITSIDSPLAKVCTVSVELLLPEDTDVYMPMTSRLIQLTVLDVLAMGVTLRRGKAFHEHLKKIKDSLKETRYSTDT